MLRSLIQKANKYSLEEELAEIVNICESQLEKIAIERLEEIDSEVDELVADINEVPTEDDIAARNPPLCEGCEE